MTVELQPTLNNLPCELLAEILALSTDYNQLLDLVLLSKNFYAAFQALKPTIFTKVTKSMVGGEAFDDLVIVLRHQRHSRTEEFAGLPIVIADYPKIKATLKDKFSFTLEDAKHVKENQAHFQMVQESFGPSLAAIHRLDIKNSTFRITQNVSIEMFYEFWVAALRFGLESISDWCMHSEYTYPVDEQKMLDWKLLSETMQRGRFVALPYWAIRSPGAYEDGGNTLFNVLMRNFGSEVRVMEFGKCIAHYNSGLAISPSMRQTYDYQLFYSYFHSNMLPDVAHRFNLDYNWL